MPDAVINRTAAGWPYLDDRNFIDIIDDYSLELANKLENSDADVAAAINAANTALALVQVTGPATVVNGLVLGSGWVEVPGFGIEVKRVGRTVFCTGLINISGAPGATVLTLPSWARPRQTGRVLCVAANKATGLLGLEAGGTLSYQAGWWTSAPSGGWISLPSCWEAGG